MIIDAGEQVSGKMFEKKSTHSCSGCRHQKALIKDTMPCKRCYHQSKWKPMTPRQMRIRTSINKDIEAKVASNKVDMKNYKSN